MGRGPFLSHGRLSLPPNRTLLSYNRCQKIASGSSESDIPRPVRGRLGSPLRGRDPCPRVRTRLLVCAPASGPASCPRAAGRQRVWTLERRMPCPPSGAATGVPGSWCGGLYRRANWHLNNSCPGVKPTRTWPHSAHLCEPTWASSLRAWSRVRLHLCPKDSGPPSPLRG